MKSKGYLNFVGEYPCCVTGETHNVDLHHEEFIQQYSGSRKRQFDFGVLPLAHNIHLQERHYMGKDKFWDTYQQDPLEIAIEMVQAYIDSWPEDVELAEEALEMLKDVR